jgi:hypothetical protein
VAEGTADIGICTLAHAAGNGQATPALQRRPYREDRLVVVVPSARAGAGLCRCWNGTSSACMRQLHQPGHACSRGPGRPPLHQRIQVTSLDAMCRMIDNGLGVGLLPDRAFELMHGVGHLRAVQLTDDWAQRGDLVARDFDALPVTARLLVEHLWPAAARPEGPIPPCTPEFPHNTNLRDRHGTHPLRQDLGRARRHTEEDGTAVLYIDRHLVHEVTSPQAFEGLRMAGRKVWRVSSVVATADHNTPTTAGSAAMTASPTHQQGADHHAGQQHRRVRRGGLLPSWTSARASST